MLIVPLHRRPGWAALPWATIALVLANVLVFVGFQSGDKAAFERAAGYYRSSGLAEVEAPRIDAALRADGQDKLADQLGAAPEPLRSQVLLRLTASESVLAEEVREGRLLEPTHPEFGYWRERRARLTTMLDDVFTLRHVLRYEEPKLSTALTSIFMHGDLEHLIGNMIFLVLLGLLVEGALGASFYLGLYLLCGLGGAGLSILLHLDQSGSVLGASGAIAGLMGAFCVLWGLRKVRVFYWLFVVMGQARVVALWLLPFWLGWELWQWAGERTGVAFDAHAGGMITGALAAFAIRAAGRERKDFLDHELVEDRGAALHEQARRALGRLEFAQARAAVAELHQRAPGDPAMHELRYRAWRASPQDPAFHDSARALLLDPRRAGRTAAEHVALFEDYLVAAQRRPKLSAPELLTLARRWIAAAQPAAAERLLQRMVERQPDLPGLSEACYDLWLSLREHAPGHAAQVQSLIERRFPGSAQAAKFRTLQPASNASGPPGRS